jgi:hypothetical protein
VCGKGIQELELGETRKLGTGLTPLSREIFNAPDRTDRCETLSCRFVPMFQGHKSATPGVSVKLCPLTYDTDKSIVLFR